MSKLMVIIHLPGFNELEVTLEKRGPDGYFSQTDFDILREQLILWEKAQAGKLLVKVAQAEMGYEGQR